MPGTYPKITVVDKDLVFRHHGSVKANVFEIEANGSKLDLIDFSAAEVFANKSRTAPHTSRNAGNINGSYLMPTIVLAYSTLNYLKITGLLNDLNYRQRIRWRRYQFFSQVPVGGGIESI